MFRSIQANQHVALRLPNDSVKVEQLLPNTLVNLGKYGSFHARSIIGRPYHLTFEILDRFEQNDGRELRIVRASEIHAETILEEAEPDLVEDTLSSTPMAGQFDEYGLPNTTEKSNVNIIDNTENQKLSYMEIEALKSEQLTNPKDLISKIMANHSQIDQKTAFSLAKYILRKQKKYMKRFTVLPLDVATLTDWMMNEKDFTKVMEMRIETLGLIGSWANVHAASETASELGPQCRYLVVDDTSGLVTAAVAERMGLLHHHKQNQDRERQQPVPKPQVQHQQTGENGTSTSETPQDQTTQSPDTQPRRPRHEHPSATSNTITIVHANQQPNLSLLRYFAFDPTQRPSPADPSPHPLHTHLSTLTWLQLIHPEKDTSYAQEPPEISVTEISKMKPNHRSDYFRKRRRWTRIQQVVNTARAGNFDALIVASSTNPVSICKHLVPLLAGGAQVVVYHHHIEPLMELCDAYSTARRAAYLQWKHKRIQMTQDDEDGVRGEAVDDAAVEAQVEVDMANLTPPENQNVQEEAEEETDESKMFPLDPTLLLTPAVHHSVARHWQVLPGRTHPLMMGKGGAEAGYVMVSTRVVPIKDIAVQARGRQGKQRKKRGDDRPIVEKRQKMEKRSEETDAQEWVKLEKPDEMDQDLEKDGSLESS